MGTFKFPVKYDRDGNLTHKTCNGPLHIGGTLLRISNFYSRGGGRKGPRAWCKNCESYYASKIKNKSPVWKQQIPAREVMFVFDELIRRIGIHETVRRVGMSPQTLWMLTHNRSKFVGRHIVEKAMRVLVECRANKEVRHKDSIHRGTSMRGEAEKPVKSPKDLYKPQGDIENEIRRAYRRQESGRLT